MMEVHPTLHDAPQGAYQTRRVGGTGRLEGSVRSARPDVSGSGPRADSAPARKSGAKAGFAAVLEQALARETGEDARQQAHSPSCPPPEAWDFARQMQSREIATTPLPSAPLNNGAANGFDPRGHLRTGVI